MQQERSTAECSMWHGIKRALTFIGYGSVSEWKGVMGTRDSLLCFNWITEGYRLSAAL